MRSYAIYSKDGKINAKQYVFVCLRPILRYAFAYCRASNLLLLFAAILVASFDIQRCIQRKNDYVCFDRLREEIGINNHNVTTFIN